ncbi:MAG: multicopper oxidase family protein [Rhizobiales bacterium]|nr:multicopper oxidase family protein [Hyphomicrobiales bacterium]
MISRRALLSLAAAGMAAPRFAFAQSSDGVIEIRAMKLEGQVLDAGQPGTELWSYGPTWPQPILRARQGQEFVARFVNELDATLSLHWYGVRGPAEMMSLRIAPGDANAFECRFTPPDAGTFWLGPIADVSRQREMGLYAMLIVEESEPLSSLVEVPLVLDDWKLDDEGRIDDDFDDIEEAIAQGRLGNWFTVNGGYRPRIEVPRGRIARLRMLNTANVRTIGVQFKGADPWIAALDGQPIRPVKVGTGPLLLAPGQRADLLLAESADEVILALDLFEDVVEIAYIERVGDGTASLPDDFMLPLNPLPPDIDVKAARKVPFVIEGGAKGGLKSATYGGEKLDIRALLERNLAWAFNGTASLAADPWQTFNLGEVVLLDVENRTAFAQPLHIHGHVWREVERAGKPIVDGPWRDTAVIPPKTSAKLVMRFDNPGDWALQSTIAERIDTGLITAFRVSESA